MVEGWWFLYSVVGGGRRGKVMVLMIFCLTFSLEKCIYRSVNSEVNNK